jgi:hypothetical protein
MAKRSKITKAVIPMKALRLYLHLPLPFAGITQTGSEGLPAFFDDGDSQLLKLP